MTAVTAVPGRGSLISRVIAACTSTPRSRRRAAAIASVVVDNMTTVAAFAAVDYGVFLASHVAGWIVAGVLSLALEWKIRG